MSPGHYGRPAGSSVLLAMLVLALTPTTLFAWGSIGHRIVGEVAQRHLDPAVAKRVDEILDGQSLPEVATWSDDIRSDPNWSCASPFHYITAPVGISYFDYNAQLPEDKRPHGDALRGVAYFESVLGDASATHEAKKNALRFLVHLVGDLHQPLHNGRGCDLGGNTVTVNYFGDDVNLHVVWDEKLIESQRLSYTEFADFIDHFSRPATAMLTSATPIDWVNDSQALLDSVYTCDSTARGDRCTCFCGDCANGESVFGGCKAAMCPMFQAGPINLKWGYRARNMDSLNTQLGNAGVRLAGMLNRVLSKNPRRHPGYEQYQAFKREIQAMADWDTPFESCMQKNQQD